MNRCRKARELEGSGFVKVIRKEKSDEVFIAFSGGGARQGQFQFNVSHFEKEYLESVLLLAEDQLIHHERMGNPEISNVFEVTKNFKTHCK